ncbi:transglutaminase domain-containing protein [Pseudoflavonifractor sp. 60]|uniref:transglutaminase-like domain-containing protein n=1 Tax=Pseudoflavonifractor sp. 60 TaxID=2304576 RepID=UPI00137129CC|nr:transglutaminase-like domain-containing protein [Pseudoflavonifractor sp. 60]NBI65791.1 transglutaminase domain-containing protein [Pseudoflavonifractor sp. 60]
MKIMRRLIPLALAISMLAGCAQGAGGASSESMDLSEMYVDRVTMEEVEIEDEAVALAGAPAALNDMILPVASGTLVKQNSRATIDYSNTKDGYVMVNFTGTTNTRLKVLVRGPSYAASKLQYQYDIATGQWYTFPLSDGNGEYTVSVMENTTDSKYAQVLSVKFTVSLSDEFAPFLRPNQYVDYASAPKTVAKAAELAGSETDPLKLVEKVYDYVVKNFTYDKQLAATVQSGYLPVLDNVLAAKKGICFDYAGLMTGMLRSLGVPCKLITGYVPIGSGKTGYHAWISVYSEENGWVEGAIYFDGSAWQRMDPTFASSSNNSDSILQYIGDGSNYSVKYIY